MDGLCPRISVLAFQEKVFFETYNLPKSDVTVVGSDQVWNRDITGCFGNPFFLDFANDQRKVAMSSSFGKGIWDEDKKYTAAVKALLSQFSVISVRESSGVKIINNTLAYAN